MRSSNYRYGRRFGSYGTPAMLLTISYVLRREEADYHPPIRLLRHFLSVSIQYLRLSRSQMLHLVCILHIIIRTTINLELHYRGRAVFPITRRKQALSHQVMIQMVEVALAITMDSRSMNTAFTPRIQFGRLAAVFRISVHVRLSKRRGHFSKFLYNYYMCDTHTQRDTLFLSCLLRILYGAMTGGLGV